MVLIQKMVLNYNGLYNKLVFITTNWSK